MPCFNIDTNQALDEASMQAVIMKKASSFIAGLLGKPEPYVMISIKPGTPFNFGVANPVAFVRLRSIGLPKDQYPEFSKKIFKQQLHK